MTDTPLFRISLAQWSLHRTIRAGELDHLDFARLARERFGLDAVEYVNTFFKDKAGDAAYLREMQSRADDVGVRSLLIMIDREGDIGHPEEAQRGATIEQHQPWLEAAAALGCHSIRVNARSEGTPDQQHDLVSDGLRRLCERAEPLGINVLVENHGGQSSDAAWLAGVMRAVDHPLCGTLPDFGNFYLKPGMPDLDDMDTHWYDRYQGVTELMPFAKAVSAKSNVFDDAGNEVETDYRRMLRIVCDAGYAGYVGIEYEGRDLDEMQGIIATKALLERVRDDMAAAAT